MMLTSLLLAALTAATAPDDRQQSLLAVAKTLLPQPSSESIEIRPSAIPDIFEISQGTQVFYLTADGSHLLAGPLYDVQSKQDLTAQRQALARSELLARAELDTKIMFPAATATPKRVTVVTNIDCTFCRRLHSQLEDYLAAGIELQYVLLPNGSPQSYQRTAALLCASDPGQAVSQALLGQPVTATDASCQHGLDQHIALAGKLGAGSTPNLILPSGELIAGYQSPQQLKLRLQ